ncbi:ABC transporter substrate-binding protein [Salibacterium sp. K-3]
MMPCIVRWLDFVYCSMIRYGSGYNKAGGMMVLLAVLFLSGCDQSESPEESAEADMKNVSIQAGEMDKEDRIHALPQFQELHDKGVLTVSMYERGRKPFFYKDENGELAGLDVDIASDIAAHLGVEVEFKRTAQTFDSVVNQVAEGEADIGLSKLSVTLNRAQRVQYTEPYVRLNHALLVNRLQYSQLEHQAESTLATLQSNENVTIAAQEGTVFMDQAQSLFPDATVKAETDILESVYEGEVLAALYDEHEINTFLEDNPDKAIDVQFSVMEDLVDPLGIAVAGEKDQLRDWIDLYLELRQSYIEERLKEYGIVTGAAGDD